MNDTIEAPKTPERNAGRNLRRQFADLAHKVRALSESLPEENFPAAQTFLAIGALRIAASAIEDARAYLFPAGR